MMTIRGKLCLSAAAIGIAVLAAAPFSRLCAQQPSSPPGVTVGQADLGGTVSGAGGPEAGVWVIAETTDLPTKFAKIVVTDDQGRYSFPICRRRITASGCAATAWSIRAKAQATPGKHRSTSGPWPRRSDGRRAILSRRCTGSRCSTCPAKSEFPLREDQEPGRVAEHHQERRLPVVPRAGHAGHADDLAGARPVPELHRGLARRLQSGSAQTFMIARHQPPRHAARDRRLFADWTDRIAEGELPFAKPARPQGIERNVVITMWDWGSPTAYLHDAVSTDRRNPRVNANGKIYGSPEDSTDIMPVLDPVDQHGERGAASGARSEDADRPRTTRWRRRRTGATSRSGTARRSTTTR